MRVLVTGATGFIGSHLVERLRADGHEVAALARGPAKAAAVERLGARAVLGDLREEGGLDAAVESAERVFHVAGLVKARNEAEYLEVNRDGTRRLAAAARRAGSARFVLVSSMAAAGPSTPGRRGGSDDPANPVTAYGRSKLAGEQVLREIEIPSTILRPPMVYGPRDVEVFKLFKTVRRGLAPVFGEGDQELSAIYAADLVEAIVAAAETPAAVGRTYCACHPEIFTSLELARAVGRAMQREVRVLRLSPGVARSVLGLTEAVARLFGRATVLNRDKANEFLAPAWTGDPAPLERETGWRARFDLQTGLAASAAWYREHGWL
jgi:nucleoside-diphosphate-sugar epimerase